MTSPPNSATALLSTKKKALKRSSELWYDDGTIVIRAEDTVFRVYRGILTHYSTIFDGFLAIPQSPEVREKYNGCPLVALTESAEEIVVLLRALFDPSTPTLSVESDLRDLSILFRLGTKYEMEHLRKSALNTLKVVYPTTFDCWDACTSIRKATPWGDAPGALFHLANICSTLQAEIFLPSLLFLCAKSSVKDILDGVTYGGKHYKLEYNLQRAVLIARHELHVLAQTKKLPPNTSNCSSCNSNKRSLRAFYPRPEEEGVEVGGKSEIYSGGRLLDDHSPEADIGKDELEWLTCERCREAFEAVEGERAALWDTLPMFFGLGEWSKLEGGMVTP